MDVLRKQQNLKSTVLFERLNHFVINADGKYVIMKEPIMSKRVQFLLKRFVLVKYYF